MIRLQFNPPNSPAWNTWVANCTHATDLLIQSYQNGAPIAITTLYRDFTDHYHHFPYFGKCAYCESKIETTSPDYVEHFRPKKQVTNLANQIVMVPLNGANGVHPGYYWLSYKWENLLPTCWKCNTRHDEQGIMVGKGTRFPVTGSYAVNPGDELAEQHDLIHPGIEDPDAHIHIDKLGVLHPRNASVKGSTTISVFGLNIREPLVNARKREYENIAQKLKLAYLANDAERQSVVDGIKDILRGRDQHTIAARKAVSDVLFSAHEIEAQIGPI